MTRSNFASVGGRRTYYEVHGSGEPLILLHGGVAASECFGPNLQELAKTRKVVAVHLQGHGRTPDADRPLRCETMADDLAALIRQLDLGQVDIMGYSLGAGVALQTGIRHPEVVGRLVLVSSRMAHAGSYPEVLAAFEHMEASAPMIAANVKASPLGALYPETDWESLFRKIGEMNKRPFDWSADVASLRARTLLVFADADSVRPEHMVEFYQRLGGGRRDAGLDGSQRAPSQLAILPGATHYSIASDARLPAVATSFLQAA